MKKRVFISLLLTAVLVLPGLSAGCQVLDAVPKGNDITREESFSGFRSLEIGSSFEAEITRSDTFSVVVTADENLIDLVDIQQDGDKLIVGLTPHHIFTDFTLGARTLKVVITMPSLDSLDLSGASKAKVSGFKSVSNFDLIVSGASSLQELSLEAGNTDMDISGASRVSGNISIKNAYIVASGASNVQIAGKVTDIDLELSGASKVDLEKMPANDIDAVLSGASEATVSLEGTLDIDMSGASRFYFYGNPTMGKTDVSGASTIKHK